MLSRLAWGFCTMAFEASRDNCFPAGLRRIFVRFGSIWFWVALACEGRALEIARDLRLEKKKQQRERIVDHSADTREECPRVAAWSLPDVTRIRALGLGRVWVVHCPFCLAFHTHSPEEGLRAAHCGTNASPRTYVLRHAGDLPRELRERFRLSVKGDLPKVLLEWAGPDTEGGELEAA